MAHKKNNDSEADPAMPGVTDPTPQSRSWLGDPWHTEFCRRYYDAVGVTPSIIVGSDPAVDLAIVEAFGPGCEHWLTYGYEQVDAAYWTQFAETFSARTDIRLQVSTAMTLSERLFGTECFGQSIPDVWVLSIEAIPVFDSKRFDRTL
jgi:hypothetical protein